MAEKETGVTPRNKNGKTNNGLPYRYGKAKKSATLRSSKIDLTVLTKNEMALLKLLNKKVKEKGRQVSIKLSIMEIQETIFSAKSYENYGTSDTRNLLRRLKGAGLIERAGRGIYRLSKKGQSHMAKQGKKKAKKAA